MFSPALKMSEIRDAYPRSYPISQIKLSEIEMEKFVDLRSYLHQSPFIVQEGSSLEKIFRLFRALGLRHLGMIGYKLYHTIKIHNDILLSCDRL